jgi:hypothetical protein
MQEDEAIGAWEAAALMGIHFSKPQSMAAKGLLTHKIIHSSTGRQVAVYSRRAAEDNWSDYVAACRTGDRGKGRPRKFTASRPQALRLLAAARRPRISVADAISAYEAAEIMQIWHTRVPRMVREGVLVGRIANNLRTPKAKFLIISARSARENAKRMAREEREGIKVGRPRAAAN